MHDFLRLLDHGSLVLAYGNRGGMESGDIRRLADGIGEKAHRNAGLKVPHLNLGFHCRISLQPGYRDQIHVIKGKLTQLRNLRLNQQSGFLRVQAAGQIIQSYLDDVLAYLFRIVRIVGQCLSVRDHDENFVILAGILKLYPAP